MLIVWFAVRHFNINLGLFIDRVDKKLDLISTLKKFLIKIIYRRASF